MADIATGFAQVTATSAAFGLSPPPGTAYALVTAEAQGLRWRDDGVNPTASVGMPMAAGDSILIDTAIVAVKFIAQTSGAILNVSFYKTTNTLLADKPKTPVARKKS